LGFVVAGFLVGFGAKLGGGCTSGHGLNGLPQLSLRSIVAVLMFLLGGIGVSTFAAKHGLEPLVGNRSSQSLGAISHNTTSEIVLVCGVGLAVAGYILSLQRGRRRIPLG
jgi:uncharacterized membrane protein YedE/YeeE